jgi:hypothetical protein
MQEPNIGELIEIKSGYTSYVNLDNELFNDSKNIGRMERYRPIKSHRQAFGELAKSLNVKDKRCYLLTGSYGTGKSHLCLMFANYLQTPANEPPIPAFFENYREADPNEANTLQTLRSSGRYLVAVCKWGGKEDFDEVVLKAVDEALKRESFGDDFETQYLQAVKKIEVWDKLADEGRRFYEDFETELFDANAGTTVNAFKKKLQSYDFEALQEFKRIHKKTTSADFTFDKDSLPEILLQTLSSDKFKQRFLGVLVLFDEFGDTMEHGRLSPKSFQRFAELCADTPTNSARLVFVGTAHKSLTAYSKALTQLDIRTASDRIKEVQLTPDGVEEIISAIVVPQKQSPLWGLYVEPRTDTFDLFLERCKSLNLFDWLTAPKVRSKIIENIYPMHPMATFALLQLARDVASNNRSVYTFFSETALGSYSDFICAAPILNGEKLNLYTADRLCDYFADALKSDNKELRDPVRERIRDYENSLRALNQVANADTLESFRFKGDTLIQRLMRLMLVYEIIGKEKVTNRLDNLAFGLYCVTQAEKDELKNRLDALVAKNVLFYVKDTGVYEFKRSTDVNLDAMIETWVSTTANVPQNIVAELDNLVPLEKKDIYLEAKGYNLPYSEDKQLLRRFVRPAELTAEEQTPQGKRTFFNKLEEELTASIAKKNEYEGYALYVVCETQEEISKAKDACSRNTSERIVLAIPKQPVPLLESVMGYKALLAIEKSEEAQNFSTQDKSALNFRLTGDSTRPGAKQALLKLRDKLLNVKEITWHGKYAQTLATDDNNPYDIANQVIERLYTNRNTFGHDDFNKLHGKVDKSRNIALKEAVEKLLDYTEPIVINTDWGQNRGDHRYLHKCLLLNGALRVVKTEGAKERCEFDDNPSKFKAKLPALAEMVCDIRALDMKGKIPIADWVQKYRRPPYGQGSVALALSLACLRYLFKDSIQFKMTDDYVGVMPVTTFEDILKLSEGEYANAVLGYRPLNTSERNVVNTVYNIVGTPDTAVAKDYTVVEAQTAMKSWWENLPSVAKVKSIYPLGETVTAEFLAVMEKVAGKDAHAFLFEELPTAFGLDGGLAITGELVDTLKAELPKVKARLEGGVTIVEKQVLEGVRELFGVEQDTLSDIIVGIRQWYNKLDKNQRDDFAKWQNNDTKPIIIHLKSLTDLQKTFFTDIPKTPEYGSRAVCDWVKDKVAEYIGQLRSGKERIEANRIKVEPPKLQASGDYEWPDGGQLSFKDKVELTFTPPSNGTKIYVAEGSADPRDTTATRQEINGSQPLLIKENKTIKYVAQDAEGNWSPIQTVQLTNANKEFIPSVATPNLLGQRTVQFNFPIDQASLKVTCRELFRKCVELGVVDITQMEAVVTEALSEAKKSQ